MSLNNPRIILSALKGGSGKTIISLGLISLWRGQGLIVSPFKKGPDFIDAGWLDLAAGYPCYNLDPFMMNQKQIIRSFIKRSTNADISLIEGNRGLFDGFDLEGHCSTAELGKMLKAPVVLIVDVTMSTRTIAALVLGCRDFDPDLQIMGVILNRVAGSRQETIVRQSIDRYCHIPVVGAIPKLKNNPFPERHMGLVPRQERKQAEKAIDWSRQIAKDYLDTKMIFQLAQHVGPINSHKQDGQGKSGLITNGPKPSIGFIRDRAFWFYYPENLEQLEQLGAELVELNSLFDKTIPELDGLYIGGGFPETQVDILSKNVEFRQTLRDRIEGGLPVYAECGGLIYLGESLILKDKSYPLVGALPISFVLEKKPQGHGYTLLEVADENPYFQIGEIIKGHEFHYSRPVIKDPERLKAVFQVRRGNGLDGRLDGLVYRNLLATYTHIHAGGNRSWAEKFFDLACTYKKNKKVKNFSNSEKRH
jgi:cobyrinic acid a,c-diamide synthase